MLNRGIQEESMSYLIQEIEELEAEKREKINELFPSQYHELEHLTEEICRLKIELGREVYKGRVKMEQLEDIPIREYTKKLQEACDKYGSHEYMQRHVLVESQKDLMALELEVRTLRQDIEAGIDQKETRCGRCGEEVTENCEENSELEGHCEWCGHVSWNAGYQGLRQENILWGRKRSLLSLS